MALLSLLVVLLLLLTVLSICDPGPGPSDPRPEGRRVRSTQNRFGEGALWPSLLESVTFLLINHDDYQ